MSFHFLDSGVMKAYARRISGCVLCVSGQQTRTKQHIIGVDQIADGYAAPKEDLAVQHVVAEHDRSGEDPI